MAIREKQRATADGLATPERVEKLYMENTLLRVSGAMFCHDAKRASSRKDTIEINRGEKDRHIAIRPDPEYGQPGPLAHKIFVALIKKHSDYGRPVPDEVSFTRREIGRLIERQNWGGRDSDQLVRALYEIRRTSITAFIKDSKNRFLEHDFNVFSEILIERKNSHRDPIEACTITLAKPIVASLRDEHFTCLNHFLMMRLGTIGQALYMRLFFHFANLYDEQRKKRLAFPKRYDDICNEWLGGLKILAYKSNIVKDQLGPHLTQLINAGFLSSYAIEKAKTSTRLRHHVPTRSRFFPGLRPLLSQPQSGRAPVGVSSRPARRCRTAPGRPPVHREAHQTGREADHLFLVVRRGGGASASHAYLI